MLNRSTITVLDGLSTEDIEDYLEGREKEANGTAVSFQCNTTPAEEVTFEADPGVRLIVEYTDHRESSQDHEKYNSVYMVPDSVKRLLVFLQKNFPGLYQSVYFSQ